MSIWILLTVFFLKIPNIPFMWMKGFISQERVKGTPEWLQIWQWIDSKSSLNQAAVYMKILTFFSNVN